MTLLDQISDALGSSGALGKLAGTLGASTAETDSLVGAGVPTILGALEVQSEGDGLGALMGLLGDDGGSLAGNLNAFFGVGDTSGLASKLVGALFGSQRSAIESQVATGSGGAMSMVSRFLPMLAPAVMSLVAKVVADDGLDAEGLSEKLAAVGASGELGDALGSTTDEDRAAFVADIASIRDAGGLGALVPAGAGIAGAAVVPAGVATTPAIQHLSVTDDDSNRTGLGWLPTVVLPVIALIAGLVLWQCGTASGTTPVADHSDDVEQVEAAAEPDDTVDDVASAEDSAPEPTAPTPQPTPAPTPEPTATPDPTPEPAPLPTIAELALANPELSRFVALAAELDLDGPLSDADAGPFTIFAPTNDAFADADALLDRLDTDQTRTAVTFHVVPGVVSADDLTPGATFETLAGETLTVGDDGTLTGGVQVTTADLEAANGIVHIVENVLVPGSIQRSLATEDVNQLFVLEPIQFASSSAAILPESIPTLDQAIVTLSALPAGTIFEVQGHTDSSGSDALNQALSEDRAASVVAYLVDGGVSEDTLVARGYGATQLKVEPELTPEDFAANRRIEFVDIS